MKEVTDFKNSQCGKLPIKLVDIYIYICMYFAQEISILFIHIFYSIQEKSFSKIIVQGVRRETMNSDFQGSSFSTVVYRKRRNNLKFL
jgi:hypothetical protein